MVLLVNLTPTCTELARHLVLSGINVWLMQSEDNQLVTLDDTDEDFLCTSADIGRTVSKFFSFFIESCLQKGQVVKEKLAEMNPFVDIEFLNTQTI